MRPTTGTGKARSLALMSFALIELIRKNPMKRALRADKITLTVLEATLKIYEDPDSLSNNIPILKIMTRPVAELEQAAQRL